MAKKRGTTSRRRTSTGNLNRRALLTSLGAGLVATGLGGRKATALPPSVPAGQDRMLDYNNTITLDCPGDTTVRVKNKNPQASEIPLKISCKDNQVTIKCDIGGNK